MRLLLYQGVKRVSLFNNRQVRSVAYDGHYSLGRVMVLFQKLITAPPIKLTPKENLPLTLCRKLYERKLLVQDDIE